MPALSKMFTKAQIDKIRRDLIQKHGNFCGICKKPREYFKKSLSVDHNHKSGKIRGLLCYRCNKFQLGRHTIESVTALLEYLTKYDEPLEKK
jgi:hypothetical protein